MLHPLLQGFQSLACPRIFGKPVQNIGVDERCVIQLCVAFKALSLVHRSCDGHGILSQLHAMVSLCTFWWLTGRWSRP
ncbi:hypothetical protein PXK31_18685 [Phaeobacter gallaeciensis]|uniref:hypothetical protein n=1 Tax=Phaeobacter gallaeciensis TaxID=60890 RepID=UPI00237F6431|nr:hypothetical protein [Phaeobacter gallaeciensis]MDE4117259.1 hypothetical protein [Phaeobacter gallaeciensis]MDE4121732.1 hypothetical protein [Phaeobacter gallaeciensis]